MALSLNRTRKPRGVAVAEELSFDEVMSRLRAGENQAAARVFNQFAERLIALARSRLDTFTRQKVDPEDVIQSVYRSFFKRHAEGQFNIQDWDNLWTLLAVIAARKCANRVNFFRAACRDARHELPLADGSASDWPGSATEPTPEEAVILTETIEQLMRGLDERNREILALALQGYTTAEISTKLGRARRSVQRVLEHVKKCLDHAQHGGG